MIQTIIIIIGAIACAVSGIACALIAIAIYLADNTKRGVNYTRRVSSHVWMSVVLAMMLFSVAAWLGCRV